MPLENTSVDYNFTPIEKHNQDIKPTYFELKSSQKDRFLTQKVIKSSKYLLVSKILSRYRVFIIMNVREILKRLSLSGIAYYFGE